MVVWCVVVLALCSISERPPRASDPIVLPNPPFGQSVKQVECWSVWGVMSLSPDKVPLEGGPSWSPKIPAPWTVRPRRRCGWCVEHWRHRRSCAGVGVVVDAKSITSSTPGRVLPLKVHGEQPRSPHPPVSPPMPHLRHSLSAVTTPSSGCSRPGLRPDWLGTTDPFVCWGRGPRKTSGVIDITVPDAVGPRSRALRNVA